MVPVQSNLLRLKKKKKKGHNHTGEGKIVEETLLGRALPTEPWTGSRGGDSQTKIKKKGKTPHSVAFTHVKEWNPHQNPQMSPDTLA